MAGEAQRRIGTLAVRSTPQSETLLRRPICDRPAHTQRGQAMAGGALAPRAVTADPSRLGSGRAALFAARFTPSLGHGPESVAKEDTVLNDLSVPA